MGYQSGKQTNKPIKGFYRQMHHGSGAQEENSPGSGEFITWTPLLCVAPLEKPFKEKVPFKWLLQDFFPNLFRSPGFRELSPAEREGRSLNFMVN